jgi:hypothetical protein
MENKMQMIDVLKRLAELDADTPKSEKTMTQEQSLATVTNIEGEQVNECGPMGMMGGMPPTTPASFSINASAESGDEVANMLTQIMNLAGVKPVGQEPAMPEIHKEIELEPAHVAQPDHGADMASTLSMIDKMNGPSEEPGVELGGGEEIDGEEGTSSVADMADEVEDMTAQLKDEGQGIAAGFDAATTTPDEKVEPHKYGDDQVTPKPQGLKQRVGDNPYGVDESAVAAQLLKDYQQFVSESNK